MVAWREDGQGYWTFEEVVEHPAVKKMVSTFRSQYQEKAARAFYDIHRKHYNAWESEERKEQHSLNNIKKIEWNNQEQCFHVFYKATKRFSATWYHYTLDGKWY